MAEKMVRYKEENGVGLITIDRPPVNALSRELLEELAGVISQIEERDDFLVLIITGAGEKAFVGGADIGEFPSLDSKSGKEMCQYGQGIFKRLEELPIPVIAAINGFALGGGCELALACDLRVAAEEAALGQPEVKLGIIPGYGGTQRLPRLISVGKARELIYTGDMISAREAEKIGLVESVVAADELLDECRQLASKILKQGPLAIASAKKAINEGLQLSLEEGLELEARLFGEICKSEDMKEGARAFLEKRSPEFKGQ